ncbi:odorant receptor 131-2-like [Pagrus major]|uniref:odorant receptor 131-2-like n=1 Tax=Pagrus major TaxID=143350 RepID=UPI003CC8E10C
MNDTTEVTQALLRFQKSVKTLTMLPCIFFLYVNGVMLFAVLRKPVLLESSRYILFGHLLLTESLQLLVSVLLYIFAVTNVRMISYACVFVTLFASITIKMSPLNLAVMSLERYVAVCFPLRHVEIATTRRTGVAFAVMWTVASLEAFTLLSLFIRLESTSFTVPVYCSMPNVFRLQIYFTLSKVFNILNFVLVSIIIIYTYIAIMITVKSASANVHEASKAHKTVLLHLFQLGLCLTSTMFSIINSSQQFALFVVLIIFPKCLSPLIYGLRDQTFRHVFIYYFTFGFKITNMTFPNNS